MNVSSSGEHAVFVCSAAVLRAAPLQPLQTIQTDNNMWLTVNTETSLLLFTLITSRCIRQSDQRGWSLPLRFAVSVILEDLFHHVEISPSPPLSLSLRTSTAALLKEFQLPRRTARLFEANGMRALCETYFRRLALNCSSLLRISGKASARCSWMWSLWGASAQTNTCCSCSVLVQVLHLAV